MLILALEIVPGSEPIEGSLRGPDGSQRAFIGTLGLLAAIEALREPHDREGHELPEKPLGSDGRARPSGQSGASR